ncbi:hypothetical protein L596_009963 [Steinernema carpocapsae]|uniref:Uncharacterized protein n=1 Tax=Steinernema carpocapsae TaxID=34508 RepID=A0A4U5PH65_STECR|nr:hypothetical protein L596_009963 [Steinernema carpocapsae]
MKQLNKVEFMPRFASTMSSTPPGNDLRCDRRCKADDLLLRLSSDDGFMAEMMKQENTAMMHAMFRVIREIQEKRKAKK